MSLAAACSSGDRAVALTALRDRLALDLDECRSARDVASLSQRLMDVLEQLDAVGRAGAGEQKGTALDELRKRRAARGATA